MKSLCMFAVLAVSMMIFGCESGSPFTGSQWDVGSNHLSFSHSVAEWDTAANQMELKFDLLSGSSYPDAVVTVDQLTMRQVNQQIPVDVTVAISAGVTYHTVDGDPNATCILTFTRFDLAPLGGVSGSISGLVRRVENPLEAPVSLQATFDNVVVTN